MSTHTPFSVAMSVYRNDDPRFFHRALESITQLQTVLPDEIVLVVDGPVGDDLNRVIQSFSERYPIFRVIRLEQNGGLGNALSLAVTHAGCELIARMDSDDVSVPDRFRQQLDYFAAHPGTDIVGGDIAEFIGDEDSLAGIRRVPRSNEEIREYMKKRCALNHVSVMFRRQAVLRAGGYRHWFWNEDYDLWIRMWLDGAVFANTGTVLVKVRVGEEMYRRRGGWRYFKSEAGLQRLMRKRGMISLPRYLLSLGERFVIQVLLPGRLRGVVFRTLARTKKTGE